MTRPLGNTTVSCNPPKNGVIHGRYLLQDAAARLLDKHRVSACCRITRKDSGQKGVSVVEHVPSGTYSYGNVVKCESVWVCPVCSARISMGRREDLSTLIESAYRSDYMVGMLTLTIPHGLGDNLQTILDQICKAKRLMQNRKPWKRWAASSGLVGEVRALEVTHGKNGWHPHFHILLFFKPIRHKLGKVSKNKVTGKPEQSLLPVHSAKIIKRQMLSWWQDACLTVGAGIPNEHGFSFVACKQSIKDYVCKFGIDREMTGHNVKKARKDGRTPFQLLEDYNNGDKQAGILFKQFAVAFKGKRQLVYSKGLVNLIGVPEPLSDAQIIQGNEKDLVIRYTISVPMFRMIVKRRLRGAFLEYIKIKLSGEDVDQYLVDLFGSGPPSPS